ncbi:MAG: GIY-YIG nuclease family protein [Chitinophagaceae bacterium]|nr:GIY-YIG nuclease family protein [Chitinophagaceae bacterium]MDP3666081.1 GIY-YIG nuclease family protein [Sediminibacterium sp.]
MQRGGTVYILSNCLHTVLYVGVTSNIITRMQQHRNKIFRESFTAKYNVIKLLYYEFYPTITEAILVEKKIKAGSRKRKWQLINSINPALDDLWEKEVCKW